MNEQTIKTTISSMPRLYEDIDDNFEKYFTVGNGKRRYCMWICGPSGLHYCYGIDQDGYACCRRAVEPSKAVTIHHTLKTNN